MVTRETVWYGSEHITGTNLLVAFTLLCHRTMPFHVSRCSIFSQDCDLSVSKDYPSVSKAHSAWPALLQIQLPYSPHPDNYLKIWNTFCTNDRRSVAEPRECGRSCLQSQYLGSQQRTLPILKAFVISKGALDMSWGVTCHWWSLTFQNGCAQYAYKLKIILISFKLRSSDVSHACCRRYII